MASRRDADPRDWKNFWSTIEKDGTRYRHQVRQAKTDKTWMVRTEVWQDGDREPFYTASIPVPDEHGRAMFESRKTWSNVDEEGRPMYPPEYAGGFKDLKG